jgi:hypothetical protein
MASRPAKARGKRAAVEEWLAGRERVEEADLETLKTMAGGVSVSYLRRLLRESSVALAPMVEGVRQDDFDALERTLVALLGEYERGDRARRQAVRRVVIEAKDHARWAGRKPDRRAEKEEMALWMITWLENPGLFPRWAKLRRLAMEKN